MQPINATIKEIDGKIGIDIEDKDYFEAYLRKVGIGEKCSVQIDKPILAGTDEQNRFMHALLGEYFKTGCSSLPEYFRQNPEGLKVYYKEQFAKMIKCPTSWAKFSKVQRMKFINMILSEVHQSGAFAESKKLQEIVLGAEQSGYYGLK